jgi:signal peptidase II
VGIVSSMGLFLILTIRGVALDGTRHGHTVAEPETELDQAEISDGHLPDAGTPDGDSAPGGPESRSDAA